MLVLLIEVTCCYLVMPGDDDNWDGDNWRDSMNSGDSFGAWESEQSSWGESNWESNTQESSNTTDNWLNDEKWTTDSDGWEKERSYSDSKEECKLSSVPVDIEGKLQKKNIELELNTPALVAICFVGGFVQGRYRGF